MTETFLGGFAALRLYRDAPRSVWANPWGYGIYFTDNRFIGVPYTRFLSRAYIPGYALSLVWIVSLVSMVVYARLTDSEYLPSWAVAFTIGTMVADYIFLVYLGPRRASNQIERGAATSIVELENSPKDLVLERSDIGQIIVQRRKITVNTKTGQRHTFITSLPRRKKERLLGLLQNFCSQDPTVNLTIK